MYGSQGKKQKQQSHRNQDGYLIQEKKRPRINGIDGLFFFREKNERNKTSRRIRNMSIGFDFKSFNESYQF